MTTIRLPQGNKLLLVMLLVGAYFLQSHPTAAQNDDVLQPEAYYNDFYGITLQLPIGYGLNGRITANSYSLPEGDNPSPDEVISIQSYYQEGPIDCEASPPIVSDVITAIRTETTQVCMVASGENIFVIIVPPEEQVSSDGTVYSYVRLLFWNSATDLDANESILLPVATSVRFGASSEGSTATETNPDTEIETEPEDTTIQLSTGIPVIAFYSDDDVYTVNADGSDVRNLTNTPDNGESDMVWSPDGTQIAFTRSEYRDDELYNYIMVMDADGSNVRQLIDDGFNSDPSWSPDGTQIIFTFDPVDDTDKDIYLVNVDGTDLQNLTEDNRQLNFSEAWSPDGTKILFTSNRSGSLNLFTMSPDGSDVQQITNDTGDGIQQGQWSPDGQQIAYVSRKDGGDRDVYVSDADGQNEIRVTNSPDDEWFPDWSPDGFQLTYLVNYVQDGVPASIYLADLSDGSLRELVTVGTDASWSADGQFIAYVGYNGDNQNIYIMDIATGARQQLTFGSRTFDDTPHWQSTVAMNLTIEITCEVTSSNSINLRGGPGTTFDRVGSLAAGSVSLVKGQSIGTDQFVWYQLSDDTWVRSDVVNEIGDCELVPSIDGN